MARIRRKLKITGDEYNFGGGASVSSSTASGGSFVKIAKGSISTTNASHDGFLANGATVKITQDVNTAIPAKDQYIYFDNAWETENGVISYEFLDGATALPAGITSTNDLDNTGGTGYIRFTGTPTAVGKTSFKVKASYPSGTTDEQVELTYILNVLTANYTPIWTGVLSNEVIWKTTEPQTIFAGPTTSAPGVTYTLSNVSGFPAGITPLINAATGDVYIGPTGASMIAAAPHAFTVTADLGEDGTVAKDVTGDISYGGFFGAAYFGPGNSKADPSSYDVVVGNNPTHLTAAQYSTLWNTSIKSGALRRRWADAASTSPYKMDGNYGLTYNENWSFNLNQGSVGHLGPKCSSLGNTANNGWHIKFFWTVPNLVTSFSVVATGAGATGAYTWANKGGGGGGTAWVNDVTCTPGEIFEVAVGLGQRSVSTNTTNWSGTTWMRRVTAADYGANEWIVIGYGGGRQSSHVAPIANGRTNPDAANLLLSADTYQHNDNCDGGMAAASMNYGTYAANSGGNAVAYPGAGAGGYAGEGANSSTASLSAPNGSGAGGSGGYQSSTYGNSAGGGVGLDGQGGGGPDGNGSGWGGELNSSGTNREVDGSPSYAYGGGGGSGGTRGCFGQNPTVNQSGIQNRYINGGMHGGGGGGSGTSTGGGAGGMGGIRIIWGLGGADFDQARAFPSTYTTEDPLIADSKNPEGSL